MSKKANNNSNKQEDKKIEEKKDLKDIENEEKANEKLFREFDDLCSIKHHLDISTTKINEKAINKITKEKPFIVPVMYKKPKKEEQKESKDSKDTNKEKDGFNCCQLYLFPSGITKTTQKNFQTGEEKDEVIDYSSLDPKVYEKFKKNPTRELDILIGNAGYLFNT